MRENRPYGSEGGATEPNRSLLPLSDVFGRAWVTRIQERGWLIGQC